MTEELLATIAQLEEENKKLKKELEQAIYWKVDYEKSYKQAEAKRDELLEENKKLNEEIENHKQNIMQDELEIIPKLEEENKRLKDELEWYKKHYEHEIDKEVLKGFGCKIANED